MDKKNDDSYGVVLCDEERRIGTGMNDFCEGVDDEVWEWCVGCQIMIGSNMSC